MVFRLPTPFDAIVSAQSPYGRNIRPRPWRGTFVLHGINLFQTVNGHQQLFVASAETEGEKSSRTDLWPKQFNLHIAQPACGVSDVQAWVTRNDIPLCMFMPDRHATGGVGSPGSIANEAHFRTLSGVMRENQLLCIASWPVPGYQETRGGAGILILPNAASSGLLIGAVFLSTPFPDFMGIVSGGAGPSTNVVPSGLPTSSDSFANLDLSYSISYASLPDPGAPGPAPTQGQGQGQRSRQHPHHDGSPTQLGQPFGLTPAQNANALATYSKPEAESFSGDGVLRAALAAAPFDWSVFDETTDGSGSTSPGSTRTW